jgi:Zn-dependent protease with chaperone function
MRTALLAVALTVVVTISGCATNAMTGRSQLSIVSESAAINKSTQLYNALIDDYGKKGKVSADPALNERVQKITNRLVERAVLYRPDSQAWNWQVNVIEEETVNASCMPGGKMVIYTGLIEKVKPTDDELAQVMGHEISHALANHGAEKMSVQVLSQVAVAVVTVAVAASDRSTNPNQRNQNMQATQNAGALAAAAFITLPNSRGAETEADKLGIELSAQAGYDPAAAVSLWKKMIEVTKDSSRGDFMSTHPSPPKRIEALEALQEPMKRIYDERAPLYVNYTPTYQYVKPAVDTAGFSSSNVRVVNEGDAKSSLVEPPAIDATKALAFYSPEYEAFKKGTLELNCQNCSWKFYLNQKDFKVFYDKQDWRGLVQNIIKVGYGLDLSFFYLGEAAKGLGYADAAKTYYIKAKELSATEDFACAKSKVINCAEINVAAKTVEAMSDKLQPTP